jgi:hypothetical protein
MGNMMPRWCRAAASMIPEARKVVSGCGAARCGATVPRRLPMSAGDGDRLYVHANAFAPNEWAYVLGRRRVRSLRPPRRATSAAVRPEAVPRATGKIGDFVPSAGMPIPRRSSAAG